MGVTLGKGTVLNGVTLGGGGYCISQCREDIKRCSSSVGSPASRV